MQVAIPEVGQPNAMAKSAWEMEKKNAGRQWLPYQRAKWVGEKKIRGLKIQTQAEGVGEAVWRQEMGCGTP